MSIYYACAMALLLALGGCTNTCTSSGVEGSYKLFVKGSSYTLQLRADGQGTLSEASKVIGDLHWTLSEAPGQQILELDAAGVVHRTLSELSSLRTDPAAPAVSPNIPIRGVVGSEPVCARDGRLKKVVINYEEPLAFRRSENRS